jgi:hypothetical protein
VVVVVAACLLATTLSFRLALGQTGQAVAVERPAHIHQRGQAVLAVAVAAHKLLAVVEDLAAVAAGLTEMADLAAAVERKD